MQIYLDMIPPAANLLAPLGLLALYVLLAGLGLRRAWRHPSAVAFWTLLLAVGIVSILRGFADREPTRNLHTVPPGVRGALVTMAATFVFLGIPAAIFGRLRSASLVARSVGTFVSGALILPIAVGVLLYLACMADLGCV